MEERGDYFLRGIKRFLFTLSEVERFAQFFFEKIFEGFLRDFTGRTGKDEADGFGAKRAKRTFEFTLLVIVTAARVDGFVFENQGSVVKKRVVPFSRSDTRILQFLAMA